jgi:hypothetical protein
MTLMNNYRTLMKMIQSSFSYDVRSTVDLDIICTIITLFIPSRAFSFIHTVDRPRTRNVSTLDRNTRLVVSHQAICRPQLVLEWTRRWSDLSYGDETIAIVVSTVRREDYLHYHNVVYEKEMNRIIPNHNIGAWLHGDRNFAPPRHNWRISPLKLFLQTLRTTPRRHYSHSCTA